MKPLPPERIESLRRTADGEGGTNPWALLLIEALDAEAYWRNVVAETEFTGGGYDGYPGFCGYCGEDDETLPVPTPRHSQDYVTRYERHQAETALFQPNRADVINGVIQNPIKINDCTRHKLDCPYVFANQLKRWES